MQACLQNSVRLEILLLVYFSWQYNREHEKKYKPSSSTKACFYINIFATPATVCLPKPPHSPTHPLSISFPPLALSLSLSFGSLDTIAGQEIPLP